MRIGIFYETTFPDFKGGVERWFSQLAHGLTKWHFDVQYFNTGGKTSTLDDVEYISLETKSKSFQKTGARSSRNALSFAMSIFMGLKNYKIDVVYLSAFPFFHIWASGLVRIIYRKRYKIYVEWFELPSLDYWKKEFGFMKGMAGFLIQQMSVRMSDVNVCYLDSTAHQLNMIKTNHQVTLRLPGICIAEYEKEPSAQNVTKKDICQIGRLTPDKNPLLGLAAIKLLRERGWTGKFHLIGSGPLEKKILDYVSENDMSEYVTLHVNGDDILREEILRTSVALLHPSKREGFGLAIVEAASLGVPAILIRSKDNKSIELCINPTLTAESDNLHEIVGLLEKVLNFQDVYVEECHQWNIQKRPKFLAIDSIKELALHFNDIK